MTRRPTKSADQISKTEPLPAKRPSRALRIVAAVALLVAFTMVGALAWRWHAERTLIEASLPALPSFKGKPEKLLELVRAADAKARDRDAGFVGIGELGRFYHANEFRAEAEACWRLLHRLQPKEGRWTYYLADLRRSASEYTEMAAFLEGTVQLSPTYAPAWLQLASWELKNGRRASAERYYLRRLELLPGDPYSSFGLARVAMQDGRADEARRLIERLVRDAPDFSPGHNMYAEMLAGAGDVEGARRERWLGREAGRFREADDPWLHEMRDWCYDPKKLYVLATMDYQTSQSDKGVGLFQRAIELAPDEPDGYEQLGDLYVKLGEPEKARAILEEGIRRYHGRRPSPMIYVNLSHAHRLLKQPEIALRVAQDGLANAGEAHEIYDAVGVALGDLGRHTEAIEAFNEALVLSPNDPNTNYNLSISLLSLSRYEEAYKSLQRALTLQPTFPKALVMLSRLDLEAGRLDVAEAYVRALYESQSGVPQARQLMGAWHMRSGLRAEKQRDFVGAEQHYRAGLKIDPEEPELHSSLGVLYLTHGRIAEAVEPLENYRRMKPEDPRASLYLGQAYAQVGRAAEAKNILSQGVVQAEKIGNAATAEFCREILRNL